MLATKRACGALNSADLLSGEDWGLGHLHGAGRRRAPLNSPCSVPLVLLRSYTPLSPASVCLCVLHSSQNVTQLALSADELVLACVVQNTVSFYSIADLVATAGSGSRPHALNQLSLGAGVKQFLWCKSPQHPQRYLVLTEEAQLMVGAYPSAPSDLAGGVDAAEWAPSSEGAALAFSRGTRLMIKDVAQGGANIAELEISHPDVDPEALVVESLHWVSASTLVIGCSSVTDDEEAGDAFVVQLSLGQGWRPVAGGPMPDAASLATFVPMFIEVGWTGFEACWLDVILNTTCCRERRMSL